MRIKIIIFIITLIFTACSKKTDTVVDINEPVMEVINEEAEIEEEPEETIDDNSDNMVVSSLDGLRYYPEELEKRPVAVSIDNHPRARWQAGISFAEIVYEFEVEYPFTRYLCIFYAKEPERIGPVRSARPYILYYAMENDGIFVHVGGSEDAFSEITRLKAANVDGLYSGAMWRYNDTGKYAPHNMYTSLSTIRDEAAGYGYRTEGNFEGYLFNEKSTKLSESYEVNSAEKIKIVYNAYNTTEYVYDEMNTSYLRFKDGEEHIDELDKKQIRVKNIIIIEVSKSVLDNEGRLYLGTIGKGKGLYITEGEVIPVTWEKSAEKSRTRFYTDKGELMLNPGGTWIQVVNSLNSVEY
ncbi:MAG TPA: DUF3048 domain-containing protein [Tissierellia bacterium]|nr:DUF3048 domain-containing protein [Tissierellia bacterium]